MLFLSWANTFTVQYQEACTETVPVQTQSRNKSTHTIQQSQESSFNSELIHETESRMLALKAGIKELLLFVTLQTKSLDRISTKQENMALMVEALYNHCVKVSL